LPDFSAGKMRANRQTRAATGAEILVIFPNLGMFCVRSRNNPAACTGLLSSTVRNSVFHRSFVNLGEKVLSLGQEVSDGDRPALILARTRQQVDEKSIVRMVRKAVLTNSKAVLPVGLVASVEVVTSVFPAFAPE
jgi:hypothetical protein